MAEVDKEIIPTLCDTGCMRSCIGENFLRRHPSLYANNIEPHHGKTIGIDGKKVETIGKMVVQFRINGRHMRIPCRIVKNLVYDFVLGWDFFSKYKCVINPDGGYFSYENEKVEFIKSSLGISSTHFSLAEDTIVPPLSKMITQATVYINPADDITTTEYVEIEPIYGQIGKVAVGRSLSHIENGNFMVELLNPYTTPIAVKSDELLGHVSLPTRRSRAKRRKRLSPLPMEGKIPDMNLRVQMKTSATSMKTNAPTQSLPRKPTPVNGHSLNHLRVTSPKAVSSRQTSPKSRRMANISSKNYAQFWKRSMEQPSPPTKETEAKLMLFTIMLT